MNSLRCVFTLPHLSKLLYFCTPRLISNTVPLVTRTLNNIPRIYRCASTIPAESLHNNEITSLSTEVELYNDEYAVVETENEKWPPLATANDIIMSVKSSSEVMNSIPDHNKLTEVVQYLYNNGADCVSIIRLIKRQPHLVMEPRKKWESTVGYLHENGFAVTHVADMLSLCPPILLATTQTGIDEVLNAFRSLAIGETVMFQVIRNRPVLLMLTAKEINTRVEKLKDIFSRNDIKTMLPYCANILTEDFPSLEYKVHFVLFKMGLEQSDIRKSRLLSFPMEHIKLRYEFVFRAGKFTPPHPKRRKEVKNPTLRDIMDTDDVVFATKIVGISLMEYKVFSALFRQEFKDKDNEEPYIIPLLKLNYHNHHYEDKKDTQSAGKLINDHLKRWTV